MRKVFIKYDPYEMKSTVVVDGKDIQKCQHCDSNLKRYLDGDIHIPIQSWIDPIDRDHWKGLLKTLCDMGDKDIIVEFSGRRIDYEAVQTSLIAQNERRELGAKLTFCELVDEIIPDSEMKKNIDKAINLMLTERFAEIVNDSKSEELIAKYARLKRTYDEIDAKEFRIVFTGTYSSGKSSTINALIGKNLLPTATGTCTAKICRIIHNPDSKCLATVKYEYNGSEKVFACETSDEVQGRIRAVEDPVEGIEVYTDLTSLYPAGVQSDFKLVIVDTPGTDSATGNDAENKKSHLELTKEILGSKQKEMVVLVSGEGFENKNISELLDIIEESAESDKGSFNDRFLFVMNMCDRINYSNEGETLENCVKNYITTIKKIHGSQRVRNIVNPRVFPIVSGAALAVVNGYVNQPGLGEARTKKGELYRYYKGFCEQIYFYSLTELEGNFEQYIGEIKKKHGNYRNYCLEKHSAVSEATKYRYEQMLDGELSIPERVLIHSGVPALANAIQEYIKNYAYPIKVRQLLGCFEDILKELISLNNTEREELDDAKKSYSDAVSARKKAEDEKAREEERQETLVSIKEKMENVEGKVSEIKETVSDIEVIRSNFYTVLNSIAVEVAGRNKVPKSEGDEIIADISDQIDSWLGQISDTIHKVKTEKREATDNLYKEFISYLDALEAAGLMQNGSFSLKDTVAYKMIIDKDSFKKAEESTRDINNPNKHHVVWGCGIDIFFNSIGRAWRTRKEPDTIRETFIDINKYLSDNIYPIEAEVDEFVEKLKSDYQSDIQSLKEETTNRVHQVWALIEQKDVAIAKMRETAMEFASNEDAYYAQIQKIEEVRYYLDDLISLIKRTQILRRK